MKLCLHAPVSNRVSHGCFDEFGQRFATLEHRLEISAKLGLNADLRNDGGFHASIVLRLRYMRNGSDVLRLDARAMQPGASATPAEGAFHPTLRQHSPVDI
jgi:galactose mutarotase-like enzyme